jgi:hypothetical protein
LWIAWEGQQPYRNGGRGYNLAIGVAVAVVWMEEGNGEDEERRKIDEGGGAGGV